MELEDCLHHVRAEVAEVLAIEGVDGSHDRSNLFDMGLDSICAIELLSRLRDKHGMQITVSTLFECPTIRELAERVYASGRAVR